MASHVNMDFQVSEYATNNPAFAFGTDPGAHAEPTPKAQGCSNFPSARNTPGLS